MASGGDNFQKTNDTTNYPTITILYFAAALTATGLGSERITLSSSSFKLSDLPAFLAHRYPDTNLEKILKTSRWAVDAEMVDEEDESAFLLKDGQEVAVICPVSGG